MIQLFNEENTVEQMPIHTAQENEWEYVAAKDVPRVTDSVLVESWLQDALMRLNHITAEQAERVIYDLRAIIQSGMVPDGLIQANDQMRKKLFEENSYPFGENGDNIIVMVDEAHRTQEKDLGMKMRQALPNAFFFGLTGTPINKRDHNTFAAFGDEEDEGGYMSKYTFQNSVDDGATLELKSKTVPVEMHLNEEELQKEFDQLTDQMNLISSIDFLKGFLETAKDLLEQEKRNNQPENKRAKARAALTELFESVKTDSTPIIVERVVNDIDENVVAIVRKFKDAFKSVEARKQIRQKLRSILWVKYSIKDNDVFEKAYSYIEQYY